LLKSFFLSIISQLGDLIASRLKREYGIKDYGNILPGHGGVMDRFDSLLLVGTTFYIILMLLGVL
jgi:phosphatidate cytidylyltransferase